MRRNFLGPPPTNSGAPLPLFTSDETLATMDSDKGDLRLWCLIEGGANVFAIDIERRLWNDPKFMVDDLKKKIKEERKDGLLDGVGANSLLLWKPRDDIIGKPRQTLSRCVNSARASGEELRSMDRVQTVFPIQPDLQYLHIIVWKPDTERKRKEIEMEYDDILSIVKSWRAKRPKRELPEIAELAQVADVPLLDSEKIPISTRQMRDLVSQSDMLSDDYCTRSDADLLFCIGHGSTLGDKIITAILRNPPPTDGTKNSFHLFWDRNLRDILEMLLPRGKSIRNSNGHPETGKLRPNYAFLLNMLALFRGEEKCLNNRTDLKQELCENLQWAYNPAPYILAYHAIGPNVVLAAISPPSLVQEAAMHNIVSADLRLRKNRILNIRRLINLSGVMQVLSDVVEPGNAEFTVVQRDHCTVEIAGKRIVKTYNKDNRVKRMDHLKNVYSILQEKGVPNVDSLATSFDTTAVLCPRGISKPPQVERELLEALICVLEALRVMHCDDTPLFHRDIRWPNVMRRLDDEKKWFIIDWDDASSMPTIARPDFTRSNHSPSVFIDGHGAEVDIWGVGELILTCTALDVSEELRRLGKRMKEDKSMNAQRALGDIKQYQVTSTGV